jgi:uncharacterized membrane protein
MKQSSTIIPVIVMAVVLPLVLLAAFGFGLYVRKVRQSKRALESSRKAVVIQKATELKEEQTEITPRPPYDSRQKPPRTRTVSPEQRDQLREQIEDIKKGWANMSEAERQEFRAKMLELFDARRREAGSRYRGRPPQEEARFREEIMLTKKQWEEMSEEERQAFRNKMRERANAIRQGKN